MSVQVVSALLYRALRGHRRERPLTKPRNEPFCGLVVVLCCAVHMSREPQVPDASERRERSGGITLLPHRKTYRVGLSMSGCQTGWKANQPHCVDGSSDIKAVVFTPVNRESLGDNPYAINHQI